jgi:hypothetical protein
MTDYQAIMSMLAIMSILMGFGIAITSHNIKRSTKEIRKLLESQETLPLKSPKEKTNPNLDETVVESSGDRQEFYLKSKQSTQI